MNHAFVTGATGLLGNNLVRALLAKNIKVTALVRSAEKAKNSLLIYPLPMWKGTCAGRKVIRAHYKGVMAFSIPPLIFAIVLKAASIGRNCMTPM